MRKKKTVQTGVLEIVSFAPLQTVLTEDVSLLSTDGSVRLTLERGSKFSYLASSRVESMMPINAPITYRQGTLIHFMANICITRPYSGVHNGPVTFPDELPTYLDRWMETVTNSILRDYHLYTKVHSGMKYQASRGYRDDLGVSSLGNAGGGVTILSRFVQLEGEPEALPLQEWLDSMLLPLGVKAVVETFGETI